MMLFAEATIEATWMAVAFATLSLVGTVANAMNSRKVAWDKAELERLAARDKLEFDAKTVRLAVEAAELSRTVERIELIQRKCSEDHRVTSIKLQACEEGHADSSRRLDASEKDRDALRSEIESMRRNFASH